jgi:hypothetical protein
MCIDNIYIKVHFEIARRYAELDKPNFSKRPLHTKNLMGSIPRGSAKVILEGIKYLNNLKIPFGIKEVSEVTKYPIEVIICYYENYNIYGKYFKHDC